MAITTHIKVFSNADMTARDFAIAIENFMLKKKGVITNLGLYVSNNWTVNIGTAGWVIVRGRIVYLDTGSLAMTPATQAGTRYFVLKVNLSAATISDAAVCQILTSVPSDDTDFNRLNGTAYLTLATLTVSTSAITAITPATLLGTNHASSGTEYGPGTTASYGHVKILDNLNASEYAKGEALAAHQGYELKTLINAKSNIKHANADGNIIGYGTTASYGHVKIIDDLTKSAYAKGEALSAHQGYLLNSNMNRRFTNIMNSTAISGTGTKQLEKTIKTFRMLLIGVAGVYSDGPRWTFRPMPVNDNHSSDTVYDASWVGQGSTNDYATVCLKFNGTTMTIWKFKKGTSPQEVRLSIWGMY